MNEKAPAPARGREEIMLEITAVPQFVDLCGCHQCKPARERFNELERELAALPISPAPARGDRERLIAIIRAAFERAISRGYTPNPVIAADALLAAGVVTPEGASDD